jgi:MFS family permease
MNASPMARAALSYPSFRRFQSARFSVVFASEMTSLAVGWQLYELTHRPLDLGLAGLVQFLPGVILLPWTGRVADQYRRERVLRICYGTALLWNVLFFTIAFTGKATPGLLYVVLTLSGVTRAFTGPAAQALMPLLVEKAHFPNAVAWGSSIFQSATILGPILGGLIYAAAHAAEAVYLASVMGCALAMFAIGLVNPVQEQVPTGGRGWAELLAGFRCVFERKVILGAMVLDLFAVLLGGAVALMPIYAKEILQVGPSGLGLMRGAPGIGAVTTAIFIAFFPIARNAGKMMLYSVSAFGIATVAFGLSTNLPLALVALFFVGATDMVSVIVRGTVVQLSTPDFMRGRVSSVNMLFIGASNELGQFESGLLAEWVGAVNSVLIGGVGCVVVVAIVAVLFPELRRIDRMTEVTPDS